MDIEDRAPAGYVDIYLLPVPERNLDAYREQASAFGRVAKAYGACATASSSATIWPRTSRPWRGSS